MTYDQWKADAPYEEPPDDPRQEPWWDDYPDDNESAWAAWVEWAEWNADHEGDE